jgi:hypothetical protein
MQKIEFFHNGFIFKRKLEAEIQQLNKKSILKKKISIIKGKNNFQ